MCDPELNKAVDDSMASQRSPSSKPMARPALTINSTPTLTSPETWPQDPVEFNHILGRYKASKDAAAPSFLKRSFRLSDFYEAKMKKDADNDDGDGSDDGDGDDDDHVDPKLQKSSNKHISENKYPTWDARIDLFSKDELIKFIASLEAKIQASTLEIDSMERYYAVKQNQNLSQTHSSSSKTLRCLNPVYFDSMERYYAVKRQIQDAWRYFTRKLVGVVIK
ncbi:hypothetical protein ACFX12_044624 [Malus domestica]